MSTVDPDRIEPFAAFLAGVLKKVRAAAEIAPTADGLAE